MKKNWLFLRGDWDSNNKRNVKNDLDMWVQLFRELIGKEGGIIWFKSKKKEYGKYKKNSYVLTSPAKDNVIALDEITHVFARGGFGYYIPILKKCKNAYKIRYSAGKRFMPEKEIRYNLILVDCEEQKRKILKKFSKANVQLFFKPAAKHFKPIDVKKKYDCCFVAIHPTDERKRVNWVYKTVPKDLKILQLGNTPKFKVPNNVTVKKVTLDRMPKYMNQCRVLIAPYTKDDSAPRVIAEAMACDVRPFILDTVRHNYGQLFTMNEKRMWKSIKRFIEIFGYKPDGEISKHYNEYFSMKHAVAHLKGLINGT